MCNPLAVAGAALGALQIYGQNQQAKAQVKAQEAQARAAFRTANAQQSALQSKRNLETAQATEKLTQDQLRAAQATADARVSAGEAGIAGVGVNRIMSDIGQQVSAEAGVTQRNLMTQQANIAAQQESVQSGLESAIKQAQTPVQGPSILDAALAIGGGALSGNALYGSLGLGTGYAMNTAGQLVEESAGIGDVLGGLFGSDTALVGLTSKDYTSIMNTRKEAQLLGQTIDYKKDVTAAKQAKLNTLGTKMNTIFPNFTIPGV